MRILCALALMLGLAGKSAATPYYNSPVTSTAPAASPAPAWMSLAGIFYFNASTQQYTTSVTTNAPARSTWTVIIDGTLGRITASSGIFTSGANFSTGPLISTFTATPGGAIYALRLSSGLFVTSGPIVLGNSDSFIKFPDGTTMKSSANINSIPPSIITGGTLPANVLITTGNVQNGFNAANQFVQMASNGKLPALDGSALTALTPANISGGTLPMSVLITTGNVQNGFNAASNFVQMGTDGKLPALDGSKLTGLIAASTQVFTNYPLTVQVNISSFIASGVFTVPAAVKNNIVYITACGGGGAGAGNNGGNNGGGGAGGGGAGNAVVNVPVSVSGVSSITVTIGAGGASANNAVGTAGGTTIVTVNQSGSFYVITATGGINGALGTLGSTGGNGGNGGCLNINDRGTGGASTGTAGVGLYFPTGQTIICGAGGGAGGANSSAPGNAVGGGAGGSTNFAGGTGGTSTQSAGNGGGGGGGASIMAVGTSANGSAQVAGLCAGGAGGGGQGDSGGGGFVNIYYQSP